MISNQPVVSSHLSQCIWISLTREPAISRIHNRAETLTSPIGH